VLGPGCRLTAGGSTGHAARVALVLENGAITSERTGVSCVASTAPHSPKGAHSSADVNDVPGHNNQAEGAASVSRATEDRTPGQGRRTRSERDGTEDGKPAGSPGREHARRDTGVVAERWRDTGAGRRSPGHSRGARAVRRRDARAAGAGRRGAVRNSHLEPGSRLVDPSAGELIFAPVHRCEEAATVLRPPLPSLELPQPLGSIDPRRGRRSRIPTTGPLSCTSSTSPASPCSPAAACRCGRSASP
jgi:hypothetical protein